MVKPVMRCITEQMVGVKLSQREDDKPYLTDVLVEGVSAGGKITVTYKMNLSAKSSKRPKTLLNL